MARTCLVVAVYDYDAFILPFYFLPSDVIYMINSQVNAIQICFHFTGGVLLSRYIAENWNSAALLPLVLLCSLPTALIEIFILVAHNIMM